MLSANQKILGIIVSGFLLACWYLIGLAIYTLGALMGF